MKSKKLKILLAAPRGFCAGVDRAIEIVKKSINKFGAPVYVRHEIVHNKYVVDNLKKIGAIFVEKLEEVKDKTRPVIFSAHGVPKSVPEKAKNLNMEYIDATCPLAPKDFIPMKFSWSIYFSHPLITPASTAKFGLLPIISFLYFSFWISKSSIEGKEITLIFIFISFNLIDARRAISTSDPDAKIEAS